MYRLWFEPPIILGHGESMDWDELMFEILSNVLSPPNQNPGDDPAIHL